MSYQVLKPKHNLNDRNILPLVLEIKTTRSDDFTDSAATSRLKRDHSLMDYSEEEISREFKKLTGQDVETVLSLAGKDTSPTSPTHIRYALHLAIILANSIGAPKGAVLQTSQQGGKEGGISKNAVTDVGTGAEVSTHVQDSAMEARLKKMEQQLSVSTQSQRKDKVEEALRNRSQDIPQTVKRARFEPSIPEWEIGLKFDPSKIAARDLPCRWVNYRGKALQPPFQHARAEEVASGAQFSLADLPFRDPDYFLAGNVCKSEYLQFWERINACEEVLDWIKYGVDVSRHFVHFKGDFRGVSYDSDTPPPILLSNSKTCIGYEEFILQSLLERVANGSMVVWGKVGEVEPPYLVMPLTVEPSKPRLCHDERFLNLWIKDNSFTLDTLKEVPRVIPKGSYMSNIDDKSGYDHISLSVNSRKYFGVQFGGWYLVYTSLPFGFKASAYIYQMTGMSVTSYCRQLGVPCLQYIDDRLIGEATAQGGMSKDQCGNPQRATAALYIVCEVLVRVGYFIGLRKSVFQPSQILQFLGMLVDSANQCFRIPTIKIEKFKLLRNSVLKGQCVDLNTLQRFAGKCISFMLAVPGAKLFIREVNRAIGRASKNSRPVMLDDKLLEEIQHWEFMDTFTEWVPWRAERHLQVSIATDASLFRWGAVVGEQRGIGDFFPTDDDRPIHLKEADAVLKTIAIHEGSMKNHRVDAHVDNRAVVAAWEGQGCRSSELNDLIKGIFAITQRSNIDLRLQYIPSAENPADLESRRKSLADCKLSESVWGRVQSVFGPHTVDLMALDSNAMLERDGQRLRHFTPYPLPESAGVNIFAQDLSSERFPYVFPPFCLISSVLKFLIEQKPKKCTFVFPKPEVLPSWWPRLCSHATDWLELGTTGDTSVILGPSKSGFSPVALRTPLMVARLAFP